MLRAGTVYVNSLGQLRARAVLRLQSSGLGREAGHDGLDAYLETEDILTAL